MKFNHIATLSLLAGSAFSHGHASKEVMQTDEDGGKVGAGTNANIDIGFGNRLPLHILDLMMWLVGVWKDLI